MDEVWYAGGYQTTNTSYYLYTGQHYWTMSPRNYSANTPYMLSIATNGNIGGVAVDKDLGVRPVINLLSDVTIKSGNGTSSTPYEISD